MKAFSREPSQSKARQLDKPYDKDDGTYVISMQQQLPGPCELSVSINDEEMNEKFTVNFTDPSVKNEEE